jgi:hypothetical protein
MLLHKRLIVLSRQQNQGLGFVVFGIVLDKAVLFSLFVKLGTLTATTITAMLTLQPQAKTGSAICELTVDDKAAFAMVASLLNTSCTFNLTVGPSGVIISN